MLAMSLRVQVPVSAKEVPCLIATTTARPLAPDRETAARRRQAQKASVKNMTGEIRLDWIRMDWFRLDWIGLDWIRG